MTQQQIRLSVFSTVMFGISLAAFGFLLRPARAAAVERVGHPLLPLTCPTNVCGTNPILSVAPALAPPPVVTTNAFAVCTNNPVKFDERRQFALGMIETGNNDDVVGGAGEVSRFQIRPTVWRRYNRSVSYQNPVVSLEVAQQHWIALHDFFKQRTHSEPTDFDMYVLWNTRFGYYSNREFKPARLDPVVRERARRFVNLVQRAGPELAINAR